MGAAIADFEMGVLPDARREVELLEEGRKLVHRNTRVQLRLGQLALEFAPMASVGARTGSWDRLRLFAEEIEYPFTALRNCRTVAHKWADTSVKLEEFPFNMLWTLMGVADKEQVLRMLREEPAPSGKVRWTVKEAVAAADERGWFDAPEGSLAGKQGVTSGGVGKPGKRLLSALKSLKGASLEHPKGWQVDRYAEVLDEIIDEVARLNRELRQVQARRSR